MTLMRLVLRSHRRAFRLSGSAFATSVALGSELRGQVIPYACGPKAVSMTLGGVYKRAEGSQSRDILSLTLSFNHDAVDGAPAARFAARLARYAKEGLAAITR